MCRQNGLTCDLFGFVLWLGWSSSFDHGVLSPYIGFQEFLRYHHHHKKQLPRIEPFFADTIMGTWPSLSHLILAISLWDRDYSPILQIGKPKWKRNLPKPTQLVIRLCTDMSVKPLLLLHSQERHGRLVQGEKPIYRDILKDSIIIKIRAECCGIRGKPITKIWKLLKIHWAGGWSLNILVKITLSGMANFINDDWIFHTSGV